MEQFRESETNSELHRLYTFLHWPPDAAVSPIRLARHGFQYVGPPGTTTRCAACHLVVDGWRRGDNPAEIHRQRSPMCPFMSAASCDRDVVHTSAMQFPSAAAPAQSRVNDRPDVSARWHPCSTQTSSQSLQQANSGSAASATVPLCLVDGNTDRQKAIPNQVRVVDSGTTVSRDINRPAPSSTVSPPVINSGQATTANNTTMSAVNICLSEQPKHQQFSDLVARIRSFSSGKVSPGQTAEGLAAAGFYYVGPEDNVRCFWCNGGLKNFQATDNPQTEHSRWFPRCSFVKKNSTQFAADSTTGPSHITSNNTARSETSVAVAAATNNAMFCRLLSTEESESILLEENKQLKEARTCKVCMDADVDTVFLPCGHLVCCSNCSPSLRNCAICRALIRGTVKIFLSD